VSTAPRSVLLRGARSRAGGLRPPAGACCAPLSRSIPIVVTAGLFAARHTHAPEPHHRHHQDGGGGGDAHADAEYEGDAGGTAALSPVRLAVLLRFLFWSWGVDELWRRRCRASRLDGTFGTAGPVAAAKR
jgi:hypothetical protein